MLLRIACLGAIASSLSACSSAREVTAEYDQLIARLNDQDVVVYYFNDIRMVHQTAQDLCWAAALEQALAHQGADVDQGRIVETVFPGSSAHLDRTINAFSLFFTPIFAVPLRDGSEVWVAIDAEGSEMGKFILFSDIFGKKLHSELQAKRIPLVGISTGNGGGHIVTVIGEAFPLSWGNSRWIDQTGESVGFLIYDPLTAKINLLSTEELFNNYVALFYVTTHDSQIGAIFSTPSQFNAY